MPNGSRELVLITNLSNLCRGIQPSSLLPVCRTVCFASPLISGTLVVASAWEGVPVVAVEVVVIGAAYVAPNAPVSPDASEYTLVEPAGVFPTLALLSGRMFPLSNSF